MNTAISPAYSEPGVQTDDIAARKSAWRREIITRRGLMGVAQRAAASEIICDKIKMLPQYQQARSLAAFAPMAEEVDIWRLIDDSLQNDKTVAVPRVADRSQQLLTFHQYRGREQLLAGYKGILEPPAQEKIINVQSFDFMIIPAVGVDKNNLRLGYGGGFYDKVLFNSKGAYSCAAIFRCQLIDFLPSEAHDQHIDKIITE